MIDMGCRFNGYASDNARAASFGKSDEVRRAMDATLEAFEAGLKHIRAGITGAEACAPANEVLRKRGYFRSGKMRAVTAPAWTRRGIPIPHA